MCTATVRRCRALKYTPTVLRRRIRPLDAEHDGLVRTQFWILLATNARSSLVPRTRAILFWSLSFNIITSHWCLANMYTNGPPSLRLNASSKSWHVSFWTRCQWRAHSTCNRGPVFIVYTTPRYPRGSLKRVFMFFVCGIPMWFFMSHSIFEVIALCRSVWLCVFCAAFISSTYISYRTQHTPANDLKQTKWPAHTMFQPPSTMETHFCTKITCI